MSEVLTQAQIDALLNSMAGGGGDAEETAVEKKEEIKYKKYDFFSPKKFTRDKLRLLKSVYETYSRVVSSGQGARWKSLMWRSSGIMNLPTPCMKVM